MLQYVLGTDVLVREPLVRVQCVLYGLYAYVSCTVLVRVPVDFGTEVGTIDRGRAEVG